MSVYPHLSGPGSCGPNPSPFLGKNIFQHSQDLPCSTIIILSLCVSRSIVYYFPNAGLGPVPTDRHTIFVPLKFPD